ncbi:MAG: UbiX family flavin prenyltransferase [Candidatus Hodarchaeales archaeon]
MNLKRITVALTGASGIQYGIEVIKALVENKIETHVILSKWAEYVLQDEIGIDRTEIKKIAFRVYDSKNMKAPLSSSSTLIDGMVIIPATVKTVSNVANANTGNLISRAADIMLKMRRPLIIGIRETPLSPPCLHNLYKLSTFGAVILPLSPGYYHKPQNIQDLFDFITGKVLDCLNIPNEKYQRWNKEEH